MDIVDRYGDYQTSITKKNNTLQVNKTNQSISYGFEAKKKDDGWEISVTDELCVDMNYHSKSQHQYDDTYSFYIVNYQNLTEFDNGREIEFDTVSLFPEFTLKHYITTVISEGGKLLCSNQQVENTTLFQLIIEEGKLLSIQSEGKSEKSIIKKIQGDDN